MTVKKRAMTRAAAVLGTAGLTAGAVLGAAGAAHADGKDAPKARYDGVVDGTAGSVTMKSKGKPVSHITELMKLATGGGTVKVYCIDLGTGLDPKADYHEGSWDDSWLHDDTKVGHVTWVLNHSFPKIDAKAVAKAAGVDAGKLNTQEVVAATQAAIWHFSNGAQIYAKGNPSEVVDLYKYLTGSKNTGAEEPAPSLSFDPSSVNGAAGDTPGVGPLKVKTSADQVKVSLDDKAPKGTSLVDAKGKPVTTAKNGNELYVKVPANAPKGSADVNAEAKAQVEIGRVFLADSRKKTQTLISAGSTPVTTNASAKATWGEAQPVPGASAKMECSVGGLKITLTNKGKAPAEFTVGKEKVTVPPNGSKDTVVKVAEDTDYSVVVTGPNGFTKTFEGTRDCEQAPPVTEETPPASTPPSPIVKTEAPSAPAPAPSSSAPALAETGGNGNGPAIIGGVAAALLVVGGLSVFLVRRRQGGHAA